MKQIIFLKGESPTLITLNMIEYTGTYLEKTAEYAWILSVSDAVRNITVQITGQLSRQGGIQNTFKHLRRSVFQKRTMLECRCETRNFSGQEVESLWN